MAIVKDLDGIKTEIITPVLNKMGITFVALIVAMAGLTVVKPLDRPRVMPAKRDIDLKPAPVVIWTGIAIIVIAAALYIVFW